MLRLSILRTRLAPVAWGSMMLLLFATLGHHAQAVLCIGMEDHMHTSVHSAMAHGEHHAESMAMPSAHEAASSMGHGSPDCEDEEEACEHCVHLPAPLAWVEHTSAVLASSAYTLALAPAVGHAEVVRPQPTERRRYTALPPPPNATLLALRHVVLLN